MAKVTRAQMLKHWQVSPLRKVTLVVVSAGHLAWQSWRLVPAKVVVKVLSQKELSTLPQDGREGAGSAGVATEPDSDCWAVSENGRGGKNRMRELC